MERRRISLSTILFFLIVIMMIFSTYFRDYSSLFFVGLIIVMLTAIFLSARHRERPSYRPPQPEYIRPPSRSPEMPRIGRWIIIPIVIIGVVAFILFENWWLTITILRHMYDLKAGLDWWRIYFLNDYYFYVCVGIGLLIALSDPRISITRDAEGSASTASSWVS